MELILVYTGNGKGKTSACVGQALRALGNGMSVAFGQFIKKPDVAGEQHALKNLLGDKFRAGGLGFCTHSKDLSEHKACADDLLKWAARQNPQMLVLDEAIYALNFGLISITQLLPFMRKAHSSECHFVISGRNAPEPILQEADIVTEMIERKHCYRNGAPSTKGIEY